MIKKESVSHTKIPIFAYLRRSTSKEEQAESLIQQEDWIWSIVKKLWFEKESIQYFAETYSWFENKNRKKWWELIKAVDSLKTPCIILARDISRLTRNPTDSQWIMDRLYWDNKKKRLIEKIYTLDYDNIKTWDKSTDKEEVHKALSAWYYDSLDTRRKSIWWILLKLEDWQFPYASPKWLSNHKTWWKRILIQNEKMPFIRRAFEMKTEWKTHKEISKYLLLFAQIRLSDKELTDRLFRNTVYIWEYIEKTTWKHFRKLSFMEWQPPIARSLWDKVQKCIWRKISQYWDKQEWHILEAKIKSESWHLFSMYYAKQKYPAYKWKYKDKDWNEQIIHISEKQILNAFIKVLWDILIAFNDKFFTANKIPITIATFDLLWKDIQNNTKSSSEKGKEVIINTLEDAEIKKDLELAWYDYFTKNNIDIEELANIEQEKTSKANFDRDLFIKKTLIDKWKEIFNSEWRKYQFNEQTWYYPISWLDDSIKTKKVSISRELSLKAISDVLKNDFQINQKEFYNLKESEIKKLEKKKDELELERRNYRRDALKMGYSKEEIEETTKDIDKSISIIENQIFELSDNTDMEEYLEKLPEVLLKTVELASNTINKANLEGLRNNIKTLLEITTVELTITNKKELKIQLFDVLDKLVSSDIFNLEVPPGVEPGYKALQASA